MDVQDMLVKSVSRVRLSIAASGCRKLLKGVL